MAEIGQTLDYLEFMDKYNLPYAEAIRAAQPLFTLEAQGTLEEAARLSRFWLEYVALLKSGFQIVSPPDQAQELAKLMLGSMEASEQGLTILAANYSEAAQVYNQGNPGPDKLFLQRFAENQKKSSGLLKEAVSALGKATDEHGRLVTQLGERVKELKGTK